MKKIKPKKVKSFYPSYAWDSRGKEKVDDSSNWVGKGWIKEVESFEIICPGLVKVNWKRPNYPFPDMFAIYDAKIELKDESK